MKRTTPPKSFLALVATLLLLASPAQASAPSAFGAPSAPPLHFFEAKEYPSEAPHPPSIEDEIEEAQKACDSRLQEQLLSKDIPMLKKVLASPRKSLYKSEDSTVFTE